MFHCNGWGMPYAMTGMGGRHIVLRKVDGPEILRRIDEHGVTLLCGAPAVIAAVLDAAADWDGPIPGAGRLRRADSDLKHAADRVSEAKDGGGRTEELTLGMPSSCNTAPSV